jgi:hypothetical protein
MLWSASVEKGYACPLWMTFRQALELGGNDVRAPKVCLKRTLSGKGQVFLTQTVSSAE